MALKPTEQGMKDAVSQFLAQGEESIPLEDLEACSIYEGFKYAAPDVMLISKMVETSLYVKAKGGKKRAFRFARILGLDNKQVPVTIMETLKIGA